MAIRYKWQGNNVVIENTSGQYLYTETNAKDAYHNGTNIIVISSTNSVVRYDKDGIRHFGY